MKVYRFFRLQAILLTLILVATNTFSLDNTVVASFTLENSAIGKTIPVVTTTDNWKHITRTISSSFSQRAYLKASNVNDVDNFGWSVAISGNTLVIGAKFEDGDGSDQGNNSASNAGAAYVFVQEGTAWIQQAYLKASNSGAEDNFGISVAISGDIIVVGAPYEDGNGSDQNDNSATNSGAVYIFVQEGTTWTQEAYLKASNIDADDYFGYSIALSGDTLVVGALNEDGNGSDQNDNSATESGAAYVFVREGTTWSQQAYLKASNAESEDYFSNSVAISGDTIVVGATGEAGNGIDGEGDNSAPFAGAAYVFVREADVWEKKAYLKASNAETHDVFGFSVSISGDTVVVGANYEDGNGISEDDNSIADSGAAYVFCREGTTWSQQAYLKASNPGSLDIFGQSLFVSGDAIVVGAPLEDGNGTSESDDSASSAGAAYVFQKEGRTWSQLAYIKASAIDIVDLFGWAVAISGDNILVGAYGEDSNGSSETDNSSLNSGAAYVFSERLYNFCPLIMR